MSLKVILFLLFLILCLGSALEAGKTKDILIQKNEMEIIKEEVDKSRQQLDSLKQMELNIQKEVSESDQKMTTNKKIINRLVRELKQVKSEINKTETNLEKNYVDLERTRRRFLGNIRQFYLTAHRPSIIVTEDPNDALQLNRQIVYLTALANFESGNVDQTEQYLSKTLEMMGELTGEKKKIYRLKQKKESHNVLVSSQKKKYQRSLDQIRRKKTEEADKIITLEQAAQEIEQIIARLQREAESRRLDKTKRVSEPSIFATLKGQILSPFRGKIIVPFGDLVDPVTNLKSFSSGISIKGKPGRKVIAVASGAVAFVGSLRGYGNFIIINHDDQYFTTYAGLGKTFVSTDEYILAGNKLAESNIDGVVKFELRKGRKPLDPVKWIRIDSF